MSSFKDRIIGAAKLDVQIYEEVEADKDALFQAMAVVVLSSIAAGIGTISYVGFGGLLTGTLTALIAWFIWAYITYFIGAKFIPEPQTEADPGQLLRTIGFSTSPGLIRIIGIIPGLASAISFIASIWMLIAMVIAVRQALDYKSTVRAVIVCVIGWIIQALIFVLFFAIFGRPSAA
jgi:hypothetical protein